MDILLFRSAAELAVAENAIARYTQAIRLNPKLASAYNNRSIAYCFSRQYDKAWADVEACQRLGGEVNPKCLAELRKASGREEQPIAASLAVQNREAAQLHLQILPQLQKLGMRIERRYGV